MLKQQRFGVEVEFTGIAREKAAVVIGKIFGRRPSAPASGCYHTRTIYDNEGRKWKLMRDSSILPSRHDDSYHNLDEYKCEMVTPILEYKDIETLQTILRALRAAGAVVNHSCGIHIHVDGANHDAESLKRLIAFMTARQDLINEALANEDRADHWCKKLDRDLIETIRGEKVLNTSKLEKIWYSRANDGYRGGIDHSHYNDTRYHGLNLHSFFSKGTVEFRLFNSTLHAGKVKAYIQFALAVSAWAITSEGKRYSFKPMVGYTADKKIRLMISILTKRLGLTGDEFKTCRYHLLKNLKKNEEALHAA